MSRGRGWIDVLAGLLALRIALRQPRPQQRHDLLSRGTLLLGGTAAILRGIPNAVMPQPSGRAANLLWDVGSRGIGWAEMLRGLLAVWSGLWRPRSLQPHDRLSRFMLVLGGCTAILRGVVNGVLPDPSSPLAHALRRVRAILTFVGLALITRRLAELGSAGTNRER